MKKLKLYGEKKIFALFKKKGFIAEVFVRDGKIVVKAKKGKIERKLAEKIHKMVEGNEVTLGKSIWEDLPSDRKAHYHISETKHPGDSDFLLALSGRLDESKIEGYTFIFSESKLVEE